MTILQALAPERFLAYRGLSATSSRAAVGRTVESKGNKLTKGRPNLPREEDSNHKLPELPLRLNLPDRACQDKCMNTWRVQDFLEKERRRAESLHIASQNNMRFRERKADLVLPNENTRAYKEIARLRHECATLKGEVIALRVEAGQQRCYSNHYQMLLKVEEAKVECLRNRMNPSSVDENLGRYQNVKMKTMLKDEHPTTTVASLTKEGIASQNIKQQSTTVGQNDRPFATLSRRRWYAPLTSLVEEDERGGEEAEMQVQNGNERIVELRSSIRPVSNNLSAPISHAQRLETNPMIAEEIEGTVEVLHELSASASHQVLQPRNLSVVGDLETAETETGVTHELSASDSHQILRPHPPITEFQDEEEFEVNEVKLTETHIGDTTFSFTSITHRNQRPFPLPKEEDLWNEDVDVGEAFPLSAIASPVNTEIREEGVQQTDYSPMLVAPHNFYTIVEDAVEEIRSDLDEPTTPNSHLSVTKENEIIPTCSDADLDDDKMLPYEPSELASLREGFSDIFSGSERSKSRSHKTELNDECVLLSPTPSRFCDRYNLSDREGSRFNLGSPKIQAVPAVYRVAFSGSSTSGVAPTGSIPKIDSWEWCSIPDLSLRDPRTK